MSLFIRDEIRASVNRRLSPKFKAAAGYGAARDAYVAADQPRYVERFLAHRLHQGFERLYREGA